MQTNILQPNRSSQKEPTYRPSIIITITIIKLSYRNSENLIHFFITNNYKQQSAILLFFCNYASDILMEYEFFNRQLWSPYRLAFKINVTLQSIKLPTNLTVQYLNLRRQNSSLPSLNRNYYIEITMKLYKMHSYHFYCNTV